MRAISGELLRELVPMPRAVELMKEAFRAYSEGQTRSPVRTPIEMPDGSGVSLYMPAYVPDTPAAPASSGAKIVSVYQGNPSRGLPTINAIVILLDPHTGVPVGLIEGATMTALRTGAVSGAATDLLASDTASTLAVIGAGVQGVTQAAAVCAVRDIKRILIFDTNADSSRTYAERLAVWDEAAAGTVEIASSADEAVAAAEIVCTATTSRTPVFSNDAVRPGTHINGVGSFTPHMQEIPPEFVQRARIVVDTVEGVMEEAGDLIIPINDGLISKEAIQTELGMLVAGTAQGRSSSDEVTFFKSVGAAIQDMIVAGAAVLEAEARGSGETIEL